MRKKLLVSLFTIFIVLIAAGCGSSTGSEKENVVKIGVTGTDGQVWEVMTEKAAEEGITLELVEFADYTLPNQALSYGDIDMNSFQHIAFLNQFREEHNLDIVPIGSTVFAPMGIYSEKFEAVQDIPEGSKIAIPDDPSNQARALLLLESAGLITLKEDFGLFGDVSGVEENPRKLDILPMTAQQTPRVLQDVAASVINNGVAGQAGFVPNEDAIFIEDPTGDSAMPYVNIFAVRAEDKDNEVYKKIVELYHTQEVIDAIKEDTNGGSNVINIPVEELEQIVK